MATLLGSQLSTFDLETVSLAAGAGLKGHMTGLRCRYSSATAVIVEAGACRDSTDTYNLTLTETTLTITSTGVGGLDETTLTATCTTGGNTTGTMTASIYSETAMSNTVRSLTGTVSTVGTAATGTSTKFLTEVAVGDVIRSATKGASRVTAIASDTALTLVAALPGGDCTTEACTLYENLTFWCDTAQAGDKRRVNTITHNGLTIIWTTNSTSNGAGKTAKVGVEIVSAWYFPHVVYGGSGTSAVLSTQRTRPYAASGYTTAWRLLLCVKNNASGNFFPFTQVGTGNRVAVFYDYEAWGILSGGNQTSYTRVEWGLPVPPIAEGIYCVVQVSGNSGRTNNTAPSGVLSLDGSSEFMSIIATAVDNGETDSYTRFTEFLPRLANRDLASYYKVGDGTYDTLNMTPRGVEIMR